MSGSNPVIAIVKGTSSGATVLHTKSFFPDAVTVDFTAATTGSVDEMRTAMRFEVMFGSSLNSVTTPELIVREFNPTGTNTPSAETTSTVILASRSPGAKTRNVCGKAAVFFKI